LQLGLGGPPQCQRTTFTTASALAVKVWARKVFNDAVKTTLYGKLSGSSDRAIVQVKDELKKGEGDRVRFQLRSLPTGIGVQDDETLEGKEEGLDFRYFDLNLGEKRHAIKVDLNLSAQRTIFDVRAEAKAALEEWIEDYCDTTFFEYLAGMGVGGAGACRSTIRPAPRRQRLTAPAGGSHRVSAGAVTAHAGLLVTDVMSLAVLDKVAERSSARRRPCARATSTGRTSTSSSCHP
jgi:N4-gp56 family major capsid protein